MRVCAGSQMTQWKSLIVFLILLTSVALWDRFDIKPLGPQEQLSWRGNKSVTFLRPPDNWIPARHNERGLEGFIYTKQGAPEYIHVSEYVRVVKRRKCGRFTSIIVDLNNPPADHIARQRLIARISAASLHPGAAINEVEEGWLIKIQTIKHKAISAVLNDNLPAAVKLLQEAADYEAQIHHSLEDWFEDIRFKVSQRNRDLMNFKLLNPESMKIADLDALTLTYSFDDQAHFSSTGRIVGQEVYFMQNGRLIVAGFQGLEKNRILFERILQSIVFVDKGCKTDYA